MNNPEKTIIEINGVKLEVDLRTARVIENYRIGDNIRLLVKSYDDKYDVYPGVIVSFDDFIKLPTIVVAYLVVDYSGAKIEFAYINKQTAKDEGGKFEIAPANYVDETHFKKSDVLAKMESEIQQHRNDIEEIERKKAYFVHHFAKYFKDFAKTETEI